MLGLGWFARLHDRVERVEAMASLVRAHEKRLAAWAPDRVLSIGIAAKLSKGSTTQEILKDAADVLAFLEGGTSAPPPA
jgi:hypothetical protein